MPLWPTRWRLIACLLLFVSEAAVGQLAPPMQGTQPLPDRRSRRVALEHVRLWRSADEAPIADGSVWIEGTRVAYAGPYRPAPTGYQVIPMRGRVVFPAMIETVSSLGIPAPSPAAPTPGGRPRYERQGQVGQYWNEHLRPDVSAAQLFRYDAPAAEALRKLGFGYVLTHQRDGIARGTGALVPLRPVAPGLEGQSRPLAAVSAHLAFARSRQSAQVYPSSLMGAMALIRQAFYDARARPDAPARSASTPQSPLDQLKAQMGMPVLFEAGVANNVVRAARLGQEFSLRLAIIGGGDQYQQVRSFRALSGGRQGAGPWHILPVNLPSAPDIRDPLEGELVTLEELMHYERAPHAAATLQGAGLPVILTSDGLTDKSKFWDQVRRLVQGGLTEAQALAAFTTTPAAWLARPELGRIAVGGPASLVIADRSLFTHKGRILETWVEGDRIITEAADRPALAGRYELTLPPFQEGARDSIRLTLELPAGRPPRLRGGGAPADTTRRRAKITQAGGWLSIEVALPPDTTRPIRLSAMELTPGRLTGTLAPPQGRSLPTALTWRGRRTGDMPGPDPADTALLKPILAGFGPIPLPFSAFGQAELPASGTTLYRGATVWTLEDTTPSRGRLENTDLLVTGGRIARVGRGLTAPAGARVVDARGLHLTPGLIDEHSHIAIDGGVNECSHSITAECRVGDVIDPDDPHLYRHLAGGIVAVQQLHGSCNTVGGQSSLIKLRWGAPAEGLPIEGADGFIKCALGENVKQSNFGDGYTVRYPQTRMGVEATFRDAFARALEYRRTREAYDRLPARERATATAPARDLQAEALLEILDRRRFITCHSYVQSEILMLMRLADSLGFRVNTFTHILEGYKVAPEMRAHGAGASTFSDWWYYKMEVRDAIPYNAALMDRAGIVVALNSDDAEMGRRLNQEAAKMVRYGGMNEIAALRMVTLNPARLLHLDGRMGTLTAGKDADLVLWSDHPFAPGARALETLIEGRPFFTVAGDSALRERNRVERARLVAYTLKQIAEGAPVGPRPEPKPMRTWHCESTGLDDRAWQNEHIEE